MPKKKKVAKKPRPVFVSLEGIKRSFRVTLTAHIDIDIDESVLTVVDDDWRAQFYALRTPPEVVAHVASNMARFEMRLDQIDGFAHLNPDAAEITDIEWEASAEEER